MVQTRRRLGGIYKYTLLSPLPNVGDGSTHMSLLTCSSTIPKLTLKVVCRKR